jgi:Na+/proline symporter
LQLFQTSPRSPRQLSSARWVVLLCLLLLALLATVQVAHVHLTDSDQNHCALCMALHTAIPVVAAAALIVLVELGSRTPQPEPVYHAYSRPTRLYIRPPPRGL